MDERYPFCENAVLQYLFSNLLKLTRLQGTEQLKFRMMGLHTMPDSG